MTIRSGEDDKTWFRSERCLCMNGEWFFLTREGSQEGPYRSHTEAERALCLYIRGHGGGWNFIADEVETDLEQPQDS